MKNKLNEKATLELNGRLKKTIAYVKNVDLKGKDVLNIGCGFGWFENKVIEQTKSITSVEIAEKDLKTIRKDIKSNKLRTQVASAINLPFEDNTFDTVVSWEVLEHIPKNTEEKMFNEVNRVLKKDGAFYLSTPYASLPSMMLDPAWWLIGHRHYSIDKIKNYAERCGFAVKNILVTGGWWTTIGILNMYVSKWILNRGILFNKFFALKDNEEYSKDTGFVNLFARMHKME